MHPNKLLERSCSESGLTEGTTDDENELLEMTANDCCSAPALLEQKCCQPSPLAEGRRRRSSLRSYDRQEIPVKDEGWLALPPIASKRRGAATVAATIPIAPKRSFSSDCSTKNVGFHQVNLRFYEQCAGDNPSVNYGSPVALDWEYYELGAIDLDAYEVLRGEPREPRRMDSFERRMLLSGYYGISCDEIYAAEKVATLGKKQRAWTTILPSPRNPFERKARKALKRTTLSNATYLDTEAPSESQSVPMVLEA